MKIEFIYAEVAVLRGAIERWGGQKQIGMAMEECAETVVALNHFERGRVPIKKVVDEFADAFVCVAQVLEDEGKLHDLEEAIAIALGKLNAKLLEGDRNFSADRNNDVDGKGRDQ